VRTWITRIQEPLAGFANLLIPMWGIVPPSDPTRYHREPAEVSILCCWSGSTPYHNCSAAQRQFQATFSNLAEDGITVDTHVLLTGIDWSYKHDQIPLKACTSTHGLFRQRQAR
jgi:hypothetical protein